jgi:hypothetical protein
MTMTTTKNFRPVTSFANLEQFGISALTGEACAFGMRTLCDVNEEGKQLLSEFFGISELTLCPNWNTLVDGAPAIGSVLLVRELLNPLARFAFFRLGALAVVCQQFEVQGIFDTDLLGRYAEMLAKAESSQYLVYNLVPRNDVLPGCTRNVNVMANRIM